MADSAATTPAAPVPPRPRRDRPRMMSLEEFFSGPPVPPREALNWTRLLIGFAILVALMALFTYVVSIESQAAAAIWGHVAAGLDQRTKLG